MDKIFNDYKIVEIEKQTRISPNILEKLRDYDFDGLNKVKLNGFLKILENEYPDYDFSELKTKINENFSNSKEEIAQIVLDTKEEKSSIKSYFIVFLLILGIIGLIYYMRTTQEEKTNKNIAQYQSSELNKTLLNTIKKTNSDKNKTDKVVIKSEINSSKKEMKNLILDKDSNLTLAIIPLKEVWFKVTYLDNFKSKEYLTSHEVDLNGSRPLFIKFGHGFEKIVYKNKTITPNSKYITRVILEDQILKITKKRVKEFK